MRIENAAIEQAARRAWQHLPPDTPLFPHAGSKAARARKLAAYLAALLQGLGLEYGQANGYTFGSFRAGGATALFQRTDDLSAVRWRGRWDSLRSLEHYLQELPMAENFARLPGATKRRVVRVAGLLPLLLSD